MNAWLKENGVEATRATPAGDWLALNIPVSKANALFNTNFSVFRHVESGTESVRTLEYSVPSELQGHIRAVHPTTSQVSFFERFQSPFLIALSRFSGPLRAPPVMAVLPPRLVSDVADATPAASCNSTITPTCLQALYSIPTTLITGSKSTLAVSAFSDQNANVVSPVR